jgi:signal transduction histidine kinase
VVSLQRLSNHNAALGEQLRHAAVVEERQRLARELLLHLRPATLQDKSLGEALVELLEED